MLNALCTSGLGLSRALPLVPSRYAEHSLGRIRKTVVSGVVTTARRHCTAAAAPRDAAATAAGTDRIERSLRSLRARRPGNRAI